MYTTVASFKPNLNELYSKVRLASELKLKFKILERFLDETGTPFTLSEKVQDNMDNYYLDVELPSDIKARISEKEKFEGTQVHDTLEQVIDNEVSKKASGKKSDLMDNAKAVKGQNF